jgi:uncharacterized protein
MKDYRAKGRGQWKQFGHNRVGSGLFAARLAGEAKIRVRSAIDMSDQDEREAVVAPAKGRGKRPSDSLPKLNLCGDIGLKIGRDGTWYYQGGAITRRGLVKLFATVLRLEDDGRYYLVTPVEKVPIEVESLPFVAVEMRREGSGDTQTLTFRTNVDDVVTAGAEHPLGFQPGELGGFTPFVRLRDGLNARLPRPVYYDLAALAVAYGGPETFGVWSGGAFFPFPPPETSA